ncbi:MAG: RES family NAD+ phosphorylase, partial [Verrucomicrobiota bacterium]
VGEGARLYGGRWNSSAVALVYASQHKSLAALELLVHLNPLLSNRFKAFSFQFPDELIENVSIKKLPNDWRQEPSSLITQEFGHQWARVKRSAVLAVPSVIIPEELNYLLNPNHPDFKKIIISPSEDFSFDARLLA